MAAKMRANHRWIGSRLIRDHGGMSDEEKIPLESLRETLADVQEAISDASKAAEYERRLDADWKVALIEQLVELNAGIQRLADTHRAFKEWFEHMLEHGLITRPKDRDEW